jgi:hypothetical protein
LPELANCRQGTLQGLVCNDISSLAQGKGWDPFTQLIQSLRKQLLIGLGQSTNLAGRIPRLVLLLGQQDGIKLNVTDTASNAASLLMDLQVGGATKFLVRKSGLILANAGGIFGVSTSDFRIYVDGGNPAVAIGNTTSTFRVMSGMGLGFSQSATDASGGADVELRRDAADTLALRRTTNAQTFRTYGTFTDASNYRRVAVAMTTAGIATIKPEGAGTGASGNELHISGLPTANPGPGILWNNAGTPAIGT